MDNSHRLLKVLWLSGGILCLVVFIYQATPILLNALDKLVLQGIAIFLLFFGLALVTAWAFFFFTEQFYKLKDRQHHYYIRRRQREHQLHNPPQKRRNS